MAVESPSTHSFLLHVEVGSMVSHMHETENDTFKVFIPMRATELAL